MNKFMWKSDRHLLFSKSDNLEQGLGYTRATTSTETSGENQNVTVTVPWSGGTVLIIGLLISYGLSKWRRFCDRNDSHQTTIKKLEKMMMSEPENVPKKQGTSGEPKILEEAIVEKPGDRYVMLIDEIIANTLKGKIRSKEQVYRILTEGLEPQTGEIFERVLEEYTKKLEHKLATETNELKGAKITRQIKAIKIVEDAWVKWQKNHQVQNESTKAVREILNTEISQRLLVLIQTLDPNQTNVFTPQHIEQLAQTLQKTAESLSDEAEAYQMRQFALGLHLGLTSLVKLEDHIVSWIYDSPPTSINFVKTAYGPWNTWAKQIDSPLAKELFVSQVENQSAALVALRQRSIDLSAWVELAVLLRGLQNGLVTWFERQLYSIQTGYHMAGVTFMVFATIWCELSNGLTQSKYLSEQESQLLAQFCWRMSLQLLRAFARRENFPLYGGVFASFSGESFRETITYLDRPLKEVENTQEKARILTVLGYSQYWLGNRQEAMALHHQALELARQVEDKRCEVANLNHLSRLSLQEKDFAIALDCAQRALILAREIGDKQGEANALAKLGYSEVTLVKKREAITLEDLEISIGHLQRGQKLSEKFNDLPNKALCCVGLGIAYVSVEQASLAKQILEQGLSLSEQIGDRNLQALSYAYLGEACYQLNLLEMALDRACLGMYLLEQSQNPTWQQAAALVIILQGKLGTENFPKFLQKQRPRLIAQIGVDGFDYLQVLIDRYRQG